MEPSSQQALAKAVGLTSLMEGTWQSEANGGLEVGLPTGRTESRRSLAELGGAGLDCSIVRNLILPITQSIDGLYRVSQLCPRTIAQEPSNRVTKNFIGVTSPFANRIERSTACMIMEFEVPSNSQSCSRDTE